MTQAVTTLFNLMRFRSGPQDLPASRGLLLLLVVLYLAQGFLAGRVIDEADAGPRTVVAIAVQFAAIAALLNLRGLQARVPQTLAAMGARVCCSACFRCWCSAGSIRSTRSRTWRCSTSGCSSGACWSTDTSIAMRYRLNWAEAF